MLTLILVTVVLALVFEYINGFHDTANSIATVVSTKVLSPRQAIALAALGNLVGALWGTAVAKTIGGGLVEQQFVTPEAILSGLLAAIVWNLVTWWFGLPSSSSHALIGGLIGAVVANASGNWGAIIWNGVDAKGATIGLYPKVIVPMISSPVAGMIVGFVVMGLLLVLLRRARPSWVNRVFGRLQIVSAASMSFSHGTNDAQKTMGLITLLLFTATSAGTFDHLPSWAEFLHLGSKDVPVWVKVACALTMAAGTAAGGWRIIRTLGHKMVKLQPVHGFAAETSASLILLVTSHVGMPVSTTHTITTSIMGVGMTKRFGALRITVVERILVAWVLTLPVTGGLAYLIQRYIAHPILH